MKKYILLVSALIISLAASAQAKHVIYKNKLTHNEITAVQVNDTTVMYDIGERSKRSAWQFSHELEYQSLGMFTKDEVIDIYSLCLRVNELPFGSSLTYKDYIILTHKQIGTFNCIEMKNSMVGTSFNVNTKNVNSVLEVMEGL